MGHHNSATATAVTGLTHRRTSLFQPESRNSPFRVPPPQSATSPLFSRSRCLVSAIDIIAVIALAISSGALVASVVSLVLQFRESGRRDEEIRLLRDEAGRRDEEVGLLRQQVARQEQAHISVNERIPGSTSGDTFIYDVPIVNDGASIARHVDVELVTNDGETARSGRWDRPMPPAETTVIRLSIPRDQYRGPYDIVVGWDDGRGRNRERSGVRVGQPAT